MFDTHSNAIVGFSRIGDPGENSHCSESRLKSYQLDLPPLRSDLGDFVPSLFLVAIWSEVDICSLLYRQLTVFITFQQIHQRFRDSFFSLLPIVFASHNSRQPDHNENK